LTILVPTTTINHTKSAKKNTGKARHCWNVATYKWKVHTGKIEIMSFVVVFLTAPHSISSHRSSYDADLSVSVVSFISTSMG
jgi:hypothetical protein